MRTYPPSDNSRFRILEKSWSRAFAPRCALPSTTTCVRSPKAPPIASFSTPPQRNQSRKDRRRRHQGPQIPAAAPYQGAQIHLGTHLFRHYRNRLGRPRSPPKAPTVPNSISPSSSLRRESGCLSHVSEFGKLL